MERKDTGFGPRLKEARKKRSITLNRLAEILDISMSYMGLLERGERTPSFALLVNMSVKLGVSLDYLVFGNSEEDAAEATKLAIDESAVKEFYPDRGWLDVDNEDAFGIAVSNNIRKYRFNQKKLSFLYAAVSYIAWFMETRKPRL